jgi:hypothetical protein
VDKVIGVARIDAGDQTDCIGCGHSSDVQVYASRRGRVLLFPDRKLTKNELIALTKVEMRMTFALCTACSRRLREHLEAFDARPA